MFWRKQKHWVFPVRSMMVKVKLKFIKVIKKLYYHNMTKQFIINVLQINGVY